MSAAKRRRLPRSGAVLALLCGVLALQLGHEDPAPRTADGVVVAADGDLDLRTSLEGLPVLRASGLHPGESVSGVVTVHNVGAGTGDLSLDKHALTDAPGPGQGALSERLQLRVRDVTAPLEPFTIYSGPLGAMPERALGALGADQTRIYRFDATFPEGGPSDNAYAGSSTSVAYRWTVRSSAAQPPVTPPTKPPAGGSGGPPAGGVVPGFVQSRLALKIKLAKIQRVKRKTLLVRVRCTQACTVGTRGRVRVKRVKRALGATKVVRKQGKPGRWVKVKLKLSKKTLARMAAARAKRRKLTVKVTVNARTAKGSRAKATKAGRIR